MNKTLFLVLTGTLALSINSCSLVSRFGENEQTVADSPTISTNVEAEASEEEANSSDPETEIVETPETESVNRSQDVAGLIPSTKPDLRAKSSVRGRQDPFAIVSVKPTIEIEAEEPPETVNNNPPRRLPNPPTPTVRRPQDITSTPTIEPPNNRSRANLAENVLITGLVELGDRIKVILQAPEEASSRHVEVGQYISNGRVLVKRIEPGFPTPVVILEQGGIEIAKVIGQTESESTAESNSFLPPPPPPLSNSVSWLSEN
jgi:hypothetical protein